jgi:hypothetical protein
VIIDHGYSVDSNSDAMTRKISDGEDQVPRHGLTPCRSPQATTNSRQPAGSGVVHDRLDALCGSRRAWLLATLALTGGREGSTRWISRSLGRTTKSAMAGPSSAIRQHQRHAGEVLDGLPIRLRTPGASSARDQSCAARRACRRASGRDRHGNILRRQAERHARSRSTTI